MRNKTEARGISRREFARRDGCSETLVRRAVERGFLTLLPGSVLDPALVGSGWRERNRRAAEAEKTPEDGLPTLAESKRRLSYIRAEIEQIELDLRQGRIVPIEAGVEDFGRRAATLRTRLLALPAEQAVGLSRLKTAEQVEARLATLIAAAVEEFLSQPMPGGQTH